MEAHHGDIWLVVEPYPSEKIMSQLGVSWDDSSQYMEK